MAGSVSRRSAIHYALAGTIAEEVLVLDGVEEDGVGFTGKDQLLAG
jgi:hypothetical protein